MDKPKACDRCGEPLDSGDNYFKFEAPGCDNAGKHYPSQFLADALKATRVLVGDERRLSTAPASKDSEGQ